MNPASRPISLKHLLTLLAALAACLALAAPAMAVDYTVTNPEDVAVDDCDAPSDSIRCALAAGLGGGDTTVTINLAGGTTYKLNAPLEISTAGKSVIIEGDYASVEGDKSDRLFDVTDGTDATFNNLTMSGGSADVGGAIHSDGIDVYVDSVTLTGNEAATSGGAIGLEGNAALTLTNSTITKNQAPTGSAVSFDTSAADSLVDSTITQATIVGNTGGAAISYNGDGDGSEDDDADNDGTVTLKHTLVKDCAVTLTGFPVVASETIKGDGTNLHTNGTCGLANADTADFKLNALDDTYFGSSPVLVPKPGSPAIDAAGTTCPTVFDQREFVNVGLPGRPLDGNGDGTAQCDIGAVEYKPGRRSVKEQTPTETSEVLKVDVANGDAPVKVRVVYGPALDNYPNSVEVDVPFASNAASVEAKLTGLVAGTVYHYRVQLTDGTSTFQGDDGSFRTKYVPGVGVRNTSDITDTAAKLNGRIDDNSLPGVKWHFEYGTTTAYGTSTPATDAALNPSTVSVSTPITGLTPGTTYHVRFVATYDGRSFASGDEVFTTKATAVTPPPPAPVLTATLGKLGQVKLKKTKKYSVTVTCSLDCGLVGKLKTTKKIAKKLKLKSTLLTKSGAGTAGKATKLTFKLSKKLRKQLRRKKVKSLTLTVAAVTASGTPVTLTGKVALKR